MKKPGPFDRLGDWLETQPGMTRMMVYGAMLVGLFLMTRGVWIALPVLVAYVLVTSPHPFATLATGAGVVGLAIAGAGMSLLAYRVAGRHLRARFTGGRYAAGILTLAPYMLLLPFIGRVIDGASLRRPVSASEFAMTGAMTVVLGCVFGHVKFAPRLATSRTTKPRT